MSADRRFSHDVTTERKPWTHENFGGGMDTDDFNFIIVGDRSGRPEQGVFEDAVAKINLLNPNFVMSVGDFIPGICMEDSSEAFLRRQWEFFERILQPCEPPFFRVVGNHDLCSPGDPNFPEVHDCQTRLWEEQFGVTYYSFVFKEVLFLCLNSMENYMDIGEKQLEWAIKTLREHTNARWTFVFMHLPGAWDHRNFSELEAALNDRNYTVFAGDWHNYTRYRRQGRNYYMLGTTGSASQTAGKPPRGVPFGEFQHLTWVSFKNGEPRVTLLALDGIHYDDVVTIPKLTWMTPSYFQADRPITPKDADELERRGLKIHREIGEYEL